MKQHALKYHQAGLKVIPVNKAPDGSVRFPKWKHWSKGEAQTREDVERLFSTPCWGLAILCTDGMEVIDIDTKADPLRTIAEQYQEEVFWSTMDETLLPSLTKISTKSGGLHLAYRTNKPDGNTKLTIRPDGVEAVIETRGEGGLIFAYPTPGYEVLHGSYEKLNWISDEQRDALIDSAKRLSAYEAEVIPSEVVKEYAPTTGASGTPWDDYNTKHDVREVIERHGWTELARQENSSYYYYNKPGSGNSDIHAAVAKQSGLFFTFSTATQFQPERGYTAHAALTVLEHGGNFSESAKALVRAGYGEQRPIPATTQPTTGQTETMANTRPESNLLAYLKTTRFSIHAPIKEEAATLTWTDGSRDYKIGGEGMIGALVGEQKSGKTLVSSSIIASMLGGKPQLGFSMLNSGKRKIFFDTEQPEYFYKLTQQRIYKMARMHDDVGSYETYNLRRLSIPQRIEAIELILSQPGEIEFVCLDGLVDICPDFMDAKISQATVEYLMRWSDKHRAMILTVLHLTKSGGFIRGHLGTALQNKCDFALEVLNDKDTGIYTVKRRESRFAPFPSFDFQRDQYGMPFLDRDEPGPDVEPEPVYQTTITPPARGEEVEIPF
jgi:hypothetical protein